MAIERVPSSDESEDEAALVRRAKTERAAFSALYERYASRIFTYLYYRTGDADEAEDLTARVFLRAMLRLDEFEPRPLRQAQGGLSTELGTSGESSIGPWLFTIAHNLMANWHRDRGRRQQQSLDEAPPIAAEGDLAASVERAEEAEAVRRAVSSLAPERQRLIQLKYVEGLSNREIGAAMGKTEGAVKSALVRTLAALRREMERQSRERPARSS